MARRDGRRIIGTGISIFSTHVVGGDRATVFAVLVVAGHFSLILGRSRQVLRTALAVVLVVGVDQPEIMFGVLIEVFGGMAVALAGSIPRQRQILFHHLMGVAADAAFGTIGIEDLAADVDVALVPTAPMPAAMATVTTAAMVDAIGIAAVVATAPGTLLGIVHCYRLLKVLSVLHAQTITPENRFVASPGQIRKAAMTGSEGAGRSETELALDVGLWSGALDGATLSGLRVLSNTFFTVVQKHIGRCRPNLA